MNEVNTELHGAVYHLLFNGAAMFAAQEKFDGEEMNELIFAPGQKGFHALLGAFCLLAEQGELSRRYDGYEPQEIPTEDALKLRVMPVELPNIRAAVMKAILKGYGREVEPEEIDLGLAELQKKRKPGRPGRTTSEPEA